MGGRTSAPRIRPATADDARRIAEIHVRAWHAAYRGLVPDALLSSLSIDEREARWRESVTRAETDPRDQVWIAERADTVLGFVLIGPSRDDDASATTGEVYAIYVEPALVGTGIGRLLFSHAVATLASHGFTRASLWVLEANAESRRFYAAAGWRPDGRRKVERQRQFELIEVRYACTLSSESSSDPR
ncbi:MAG: N-acetyltransferase [Candidatus Rokuibacteriota bacterium]|nr:MAG: N-acetyltransferase [Candidatus Rokubacteria bacterium]